MVFDLLLRYSRNDDGKVSSDTQHAMEQYASYNIVVYATVRSEEGAVWIGTPQRCHFSPLKIQKRSCVSVTVTSKLSKFPLVAILDFGESPALRRQIKMLLETEFDIYAYVYIHFRLVCAHSPPNL